MSGEFLRWLRLRWRGLFRRGQHEAALDREMQFHFDMLVEENIAAGMSPAEARFAAQREFGGTAQYREECRDAWRPAIVSGLLADFAFALRSLRRSPGFTAVAIFTLALGIGVNGVMFSLVRDILVRPFLRDRELDLVALYNGQAGAAGQFRLFSHAEFEALRGSTDVFADVAAMAIQVPALGPEDDLQRRVVALVSGNYFALLGVRPAQGRFFNTEESRPGAAIPVLVASDALWQRLGRPADFVGSTLRVGDRPFTVVGIAPPSFVGLHVAIGPDAWLPLGAAAEVAGWDLRQPTTTQYNLFARLGPGITLDAATARLEAVNRRLNPLATSAEARPRRVVLAPPPRMNFGNVGPEDDGPLLLFAALALALSLTVLLVACLNLANMLLARGVARQKEIALRFALGASRWRVVRGLLAEGLLLATLGGAVSLVLGQASSTLMLRWYNDAFASGAFVFGVPAFLDGSVVVATFGFSLLATLAFSIWPALRVTRPNLYPDLKQLAGPPAPAPGRSRLIALADVPLLAQVGLSLALLFSAFLFVRSSRNAQSLDLGFETREQLVAQVDYKFVPGDRDEIARRQQALLAATAVLPGVSGAALASNIPYNMELPMRPVRAFDGSTAADVAPAAARFSAGYTGVSGGYFATLGVALLRGRDFSPEESAGAAGRPVAILDESLGRALFGEIDPIGRHVVIDSSAERSTPLEVVGVVRSPRHDIYGAVPRRLFRPLGQVRESKLYLHVRVPAPVAFVPSLRRHLGMVESQAMVLFARPLADVVEKNLNVLSVRAAGVIFGMFGVIAVVLSVVGVYGVKAHAVARRTREIGVRIALGARPRDVFALFLKQGALQAAIGIALGIVFAVLAGQGLAAMLYRVDPADPLALVLSATLLAGALLLACWLPARRATKVDPLVALRTE